MALQIGGVLRQKLNVYNMISLWLYVQMRKTLFLDQKSVSTPNTKHIFKIDFQAYFKVIKQPVADF